MYKKLKEIREKYNISFNDMAIKLNISKSHYWLIENRKRNLYYEQAKKIAAVFNLKPDDLFYDNK